MKKIICALVLQLSAFALMAQTQNKTYLEYIEKYKNVAITEMQNYGIPASITMAQGLLESGAGRSQLTRESNNHFGIKCQKSWTGEKVYHDDDAKHECFRKYNSALESYEDHSQFLRKNPRYASLFQLSKTDYKGWAHGLKQAGYATNPKYAQLLIGLIETYNLQELDKGKVDNTAAGKSNDGKADKKSKEQKTKEDKKKKDKDAKKSKYSNKKRHKREGKTGVTGFFSQRKKLSEEDEELYAIYAENDEYMGEISAYRTHTVQKINGVKCVIAMNGDTYEAIADEFGKFTSEILKANDVKTGAQPKAGDIVYISKKKKSGTGTYTAKEGETLYDISQKTGVRLRSLYRINGLVYGKQVSAGDVIRLKK